MKVNKIVVGPLNENCYIIEKEDQVIVIDPGDEIEEIKKMLPYKNVLAIFITHHHFDHIGALTPLLSFYKVPIYDFEKKEGEYKIGPFTFEIIETKGHSKDSVTFYFKEENIMFDGDFLFKGTIGRCDLEGGDEEEMRNSLQKIMKYKDVKLFPGHGEDTTLSYEKENNPYLKI